MPHRHPPRRPGARRPEPHDWREYDLAEFGGDDRHGEVEGTRTSGMQGKRVAIVMTDGVEQIEYTNPREFLNRHGAMTTLVSPKKKGEQIQGFHHLTPGDRFAVELSIDDASADDFDALLLPGGVANPDRLRLSRATIEFIADFGKHGKPIAAICHGPWTLIDAGIAKGKRMTSWPTLQTDLRNAGADWSDAQVIVDGALVTSRKPGDIPAFNRAMLDCFAGSAGQAVPRAARKG